MNVTLPLQFRYPGKFGQLVGRSVSRSVGQLVRGKSYERHAASTVSSPGPDFPNPSTPCGPPSKRPLILVGPSVGRSQGSHMNVTLPLQFCHPGAPFPILLRPAGHPQNGLKFWLIGRSVGRSVTEKSHERHAASSVSLPGLALPNPSTPCGPPPKRL